MAKHRTNTAWVRHVMESAPTGALGQAFVIEAIRRYAEECASADASAMDTPLLSGAAWKATAQYVADQYKLNYERNR
jgi:hypothetical protein